MKKKIILISIFLIGCLINIHNFTDVFGDTAIPKIRLYGTSTYWADSTNYQTTNKSVYIFDSLKVGKDLYVGVKGGVIYLDTNREGQILFSGDGLLISNSKANGHIRTILTGAESRFNVVNSSVDTSMFSVDMSGNARVYNNLMVGYSSAERNGTGQIKVQSDSVSDYDANDAVTINTQSGIITTKSLTTAVGSTYTLTVTNSLVSATSKVFAVMGGYGGNGVPCIYLVDPGSGSFTITLVNIVSASLNASAVISFFLVNN